MGTTFRNLWVDCHIPTAGVCMGHVNILKVWWVCCNKEQTVTLNHPFPQSLHPLTVVLNRLPTHLWTATTPELTQVQTSFHTYWTQRPPHAVCHQEMYITCWSVLTGVLRSYHVPLLRWIAWPPDRWQTHELQGTTSISLSEYWKRRSKVLPFRTPSPMRFKKEASGCQESEKNLLRKSQSFKKLRRH